MGVLDRKYGILGGKPHGYGRQVWVFGIGNACCVVENFPESSPARRRVDSVASRSRLLYLQPVDSATHSSRLGGAFESTRNYKDCNLRGNKKGQQPDEPLPHFWNLCKMCIISPPLLFRRDP